MCVSILWLGVGGARLPQGWVKVALLEAWICRTLLSTRSPISCPRYWPGPSLRRGHEMGERVQSNEMGMSVLIMQPILRFLQLLCENHNRDLQVSAVPHTRPFPCPPTPVLRCALMLCAILWPGHHCSVAGDVLTPAARRIAVPRGPFPACWSRATPPPSVLCRTSCAVRTTRPTTTWCARRCSS